MNEILEMYHLVLKGKNNQDIFNFNNINVHFANGMINVYDYQGRMPNRYLLPRTEKEFIAVLQQINKQYGELIDSNQYICHKCKEMFELPAAKENKAGFMACTGCADGGDIRKKKNREKDEPQESPIPSTVPQEAVNSLEDAMRIIKNNGYVVKRLLKSYKVVYRDHDGKETVSKDFYKSKEDFNKINPERRFISIIKALSSSEEIDA